MPLAADQALSPPTRGVQSGRKAVLLPDPRFSSVPCSDPRRVPDLFPPPAVKVPAPSCLCGAEGGPPRLQSAATAGGPPTVFGPGHRRRARSVGKESGFGRRGGPRSDRDASETATGQDRTRAPHGRRARRQREKAQAPGRKRRGSGTRSCRTRPRSRSRRRREGEQARS
jgi:hypothetical protein